LAEDYKQRVNFAQLMIELMDNDDNMNLFMSDEAHFHLNVYVNKRNCRYYSPVNPQQLHKEPLHTPKVQFGVQCVDLNQNFKQKIRHHRINRIPLIAEGE